MYRLPLPAQDYLREVMRVIVGIDLGTTNSLVAFINREGNAEIIINERGSRLTPSVVFFKNSQEVLVGDLARSQSVLKSDRTISCIKRHMGSDFQTAIEERTYSPTEISALILRKLVQYAELYLGQSVEAAVVTVPAYFNDNQRQATLLAGELAGLKILKLLNEPTAAALAYGVQLDRNENVLVLDIGGGTFDITLMAYEEDICRVICSGGSSHLGGIDFDQRIAQQILKTFINTHNIDLSNDPVALQQILINSEKAKIDLSTIQECSVLIPYITMGEGGPLHLNQVIKLEQLKFICQDLFSEMQALIEQTFNKAGLEKDWVDVIVLAGGSSRMAGFRDMVAQLFSGVEIRAEINPDEVVALGAALEAGMLAGQIDHVKLSDVTSHTLGLEDHKGEFIPLVPANTNYPVLEALLFTTVEDQQEEVVIHILQREEPWEEEEASSISLGKFHLEGIQKASAGEPNIDVTFEIDNNGILNVSALDIETGMQNQVEITGLSYNNNHKMQARRGKELIIL